MGDQYIIVMITTPSKEFGEGIDNSLLEKNLAAQPGLFVTQRFHRF